MGTSAWCGHYSQVSEISTHSGQHQHYRVWTLCTQHGVFKFNKQWHSFLLGSNWSEMINSKQRMVLQALLHVSGHKDLKMAFTISHESPHWNNYLCIFGQKKKVTWKSSLIKEDILTALWHFVNNGNWENARVNKGIIKYFTRHARLLFTKNRFLNKNITSDLNLQKFHISYS